MEFKFVEFAIGELISLIETDKIDLNPSYQRNFIWSPNDQKSLIDTILKKYPLPNFFIYKISDSNYEMVDGQQRSKTILRFVKGQIGSSTKSGAMKFDGVDQASFLNYKLPVVLITELQSGDSLNEFYVLINKSGIHLNLPEVNKSEHHDKNFMKLANNVLLNQDFIELNLFSDKTSKRMNDRAFVEELLGYLNNGIKDKKKSVESSYKKDITDEEFSIIEGRFNDIVRIMKTFNDYAPISETRFKQKSDFYTLFTFINENKEQSIHTFLYQFKILLILDGEDSDGRQFIRPSNELCLPLQRYATLCVSQSNSKEARDGRLKLLNQILKNENAKVNDDLADILRYLGEVYGDKKIAVKKVDKYYLLDIARLLGN